MYRNLVRFPLPLLAEKKLTDSDRRLWLIMMHDRTYLPDCKLLNITKLAARARHSRTTIYRSLERLAEVGWYDPVKRKPVYQFPYHNYPGVSVLHDLIFADNLTDRDVIAYCRLKALPDKMRERCHNKALAGLLGLCVNTVKKALAALSRASWLIVERTINTKNKAQTLSIYIDNPDDRYDRQMTNLLNKRLKIHGDRKGEVIAQTMVELLADTDIYVNGFYSFLRNPATSELLQLDIFLPDFNLAIEYNGRYHAEPEQKKRDRVKAEKLDIRGSALYVLTVFDLSLERISALLKAAGVPLRDISRYPSFVRYLSNRARGVVQEILEKMQALEKTQPSPAALN
jgi:DNA-binding transcriptional regulator YhcF (GntR family)